MTTPQGILVLDKPAGVSSAGLLNRVKRLLPRGTKIGHAGTLDPFATGVLIALIGKATRRCESVMGMPKQYLATVKLGATTETLDPDSPEVSVAGPVPIESDIWAVLDRYRVPRPPGGSQDPGSIEIQQVPPAYSALKVGGQRAYDLARAGRAVQLAPRPVRVYGISLVDYAYPLIRLSADVGRGFYVRSLARDLGEALGSAGYLVALRRTRVGPFAAENAVDPAQLTEDNLCSHLRE
jgi:tRNA pseudouridine55 synthase